MTSLPSVSFEAPGSEAQDRSVLSVDRVSCALSSHLLGGYDRFAHVRCQREPSVTRWPWPSGCLVRNTCP